MQHIFGRNAVLEAIKAKKQIEKIYLCFGTQGETIDKIINLARKYKLAFVTMDKKKFGKLQRDMDLDFHKTQGIIALMASVELLSLEELIHNSYKRSKQPTLVLLDEITDPHNLGAIARSAECSGADGMIITERNSCPITPVAVKASAGALEIMPIARVGSLITAIETLKQNGFWIVGTDSNAEKQYTENLYDNPVAIVIGSEGSGLRPSTVKHCDILVRIPLKGQIDSLNASVSAGVILFEVLRQKLLK